MLLQACKKIKLKSFFIEHVIIRSWWTILFIALTFIIFVKIYSDQSIHYHLLQDELMKLQTAKDKATATNNHLIKEIDSQNDPCWVELILKRELGVVPEGQTKVYFTYD